MSTREQVNEQLQVIKTCMPRTYADIQARAAEQGKAVFALVRRALRGEPGCFYAVEAGHVVGTPFDQPVTVEAAQLMLRFGVGFLVMWPLAATEDVAP